jgi:hypothetical protein
LEIKSKRARLNQNKKVEVIQPYVLVPQAFSTESDGFEQFVPESGCEEVENSISIMLLCENIEYSSHPGRGR